MKYVLINTARIYSTDTYKTQNYIYVNGSIISTKINCTYTFAGDMLFYFNCIINSTGKKPTKQTKKNAVTPAEINRK